MRQWIALVFVGLLSGGCTHVALERRTVKQASTLTDLQYQQVLDNLAMFACNKDAMAWHVKLKGGTVQIADQGSGGFTADIATAMGGEPTRLIPTAGALRGVLNQWDLDPTTEAEELELLRLAYRKATEPANPEVDAQIYKAIGDLCVRFDVLPTPKTLSRIFTSNNVAQKVADRRAELAAQLSQLYSELARVPLLPTDDDLTKERDKVKDAEQKLKDAKPEEKAKAMAELEEARRKLAKLEEEGGSAAQRRAHLEGKLDQLRGEGTGLDEIASLVAAPQARAAAGLRGYGASQGTSGARGTAEVRTANALNKLLLALTDKKDKLPDQKTLLLTAVSFALDSYVPSPELREATQRNVGLVAQAEDKIRKLEDLIEKFNAPWLACGAKHDVPKCACYVGRHCDCTGERRVWVMPDQLGTLREFTLVVLALAPIEKQEMFPSRGAAFSPNLR